MHKLPASNPLQKIALFFIIVLTASNCLEAQNRLVVVHEDFDSGIDGWTFSPGTPFASMTWDSSEGFPEPGSLHLAVVGGIAGQSSNKALGRCIDVRPDDLWELEVEFMPEITPGLSVFCFTNITFYNEPGCTGRYTTTGNFPANQYGWQHFTSRFIPPPDFESAQVLLAMVTGSSVTLGGRQDCHFDSIRLTNLNPPPLAVPTLSWAALLCMTLAIAGAAYRTLRRIGVNSKIPSLADRQRRDSRRRWPRKSASNGGGHQAPGREVDGHPLPASTWYQRDSSCRTSSAHKCHVTVD